MLSVPLLLLLLLLLSVAVVSVLSTMTNDSPDPDPDSELGNVAVTVVVRLLLALLLPLPLSLLLLLQERWCECHMKKRKIINTPVQKSNAVSLSWVGGSSWEGRGGVWLQIPLTADHRPPTCHSAKQATRLLLGRICGTM